MTADREAEIRALFDLQERLDAMTEALREMRDGIEEYLLWEPGKRGHAEAHRCLAALVAPFVIATS